MSEQQPPNYPDMFNLNAIGSLGTIGAVLKVAMSDTPTDEIVIPEGLNDTALQLAMSTVGAATLEDFFENEQVLARIRSGLEADTFSDKPDEDKILVQVVAGMDGEQLKELLVGNPELVETLLSSPEVSESLSNQAAEAAANFTLGNAISANGGPTEGLPEELLNTKLSELTADDITSLTNDQLAILVPALPQEVFETQVLGAINDRLSSDAAISVEGDTYEARQAAFQAGIEAITERNSNGIRGAFTWATGLDVNEEIFSNIRSQVPAALEGMQTQITELASQSVAEIDFAAMEPDAIKAFVDNNMPLITEQLTSERNWGTIESAITAQLLLANQDRVLDSIVPEMTIEGINGFREMFQGLPEQLQGLIGGLFEMIDGFLSNLGLDTSIAQIMPGTTPAPRGDEPEMEVAALAERDYQRHAAAGLGL